VTSLGLHDTVHIADLALPAGVKAVYDTNDAIVTVASPVVEAKATTEAVEGTPVEGAAPAPAAAGAAGGAAKAEKK